MADTGRTDDGQETEYMIPDNFIEEGRIFQGKIKVRNLVEAVILTVVCSIPGFIIVSNIPDAQIQVKITVMILICAPPFIIGTAGFNGDSIFSVIRSAGKWISGNQVMLYNPKSVVLRKDPVFEKTNETRKLDGLLDRYESAKQQRIDKKTNLDIVEGRDFVFADDYDMDKYTKTKRQLEREPKSRRRNAPDGKSTATRKRVEKLSRAQNKHEKRRVYSSRDIIKDDVDLF